MYKGELTEVYTYRKKQFITDCQMLIDNLQLAMEKAEKDQYHRNPMLSSLPGSISECYGILYELRDDQRNKEGA